MQARQTYRRMARMEQRRSFVQSRLGMREDFGQEQPAETAAPDPYTAPQPGELRPEEHLQVGPITQYITSLVKSHDELPEPHHGLGHASDLR
jgi:hypothetical protein